MNSGPKKKMKRIRRMKGRDLPGDSAPPGLKGGLEKI